jgi:putative DNA primase/helicase
MPRIRNTLSREAVSERGHAEFIVEEDGTILYTAPYGWLGYTGSHWKREDADAKAFMLVSNKLIERGRWVRQHSITEEDSLSEACEPTVHKVRSVLEYLKNLTRKEVELFDSSPDMLNVSNGVVNLKTGILTPHTNGQFFTYCLDVPYVPNAEIKPWEDFLASVVGGGQEIVSFLQECGIQPHGPHHRGENVLCLRTNSLG